MGFQDLDHNDLDRPAVIGDPPLRPEAVRLLGVHVVTMTASREVPYGDSADG